MGYTVRGNDPSRAFSDDAVREGTVVLIDDVRHLGAPPTAVRRAGDSVLLLGAREAAEPFPSAPPVRLSKFHAPEIVFGPRPPEVTQR